MSSTRIVATLVLLISLAMISSSFSITFRASGIGERPSQSFTHVILFSWDGTQYRHLVELYNSGNLASLKNVVNETTLPILKALITDHYTETNYGHPSMLSGMGQGAKEGCPDNITVWEKIEAWNSSWITGSITGKAKFETQIFPYAKNDVDFWYAKDTSAVNVTNLAIEFIRTNSASSFFLFVHYREPDVAGHNFGENSPSYDNALIECDNQMGRILSILESQGIRNSTAILVTTDHGFIEGGTSHSGPAWGAPGSDPNEYTVWIACSTGTVDLTEATNEYWDQNDVAPTIYSLIGLNDSILQWSYIRGSVLWDRTFNIRDVAIREIQLSMKVTSDGPVIITAIIENQGNYTEIPTISAYYDGNLLEARTLVYPIPPLIGRERGASARNVTFSLDSTMLSPGDYLIAAEVSVVAGSEVFPGKVYSKNETDIADNTYNNCEVIVQKSICHEIIVDEEPFYVATLSNSNVTTFGFNQSKMEISFNVSVKSGTDGFCNLAIPKSLIDDNLTYPWKSYVDETESICSEAENNTHSFLYFTFSTGAHNIRIVGAWVIVHTRHVVGDLNLDGEVSLADLTLLARAYNSHPEDLDWNPAADLAEPFEVIGLTDLVTMAMHYGQHNS